jgi:hypothetical protein
MAISIDWSTKVISVPRSDLTLVQDTPSYIYNMSLNWFRTQLKDQEDNEDGILYPITHTHNTEVTLSGLTYARMIQIINGYTVTFEDGQYAVNLTGANSNVADVTNVNQVSVRPQNSAGMTSSPAVEHGAFQEHVWYDANSSYYGTVYPNGTPIQPVNNISDALDIAVYRGFNKIKTLSDMTIASGVDVSGYRIVSSSWKVVTVETGAITTDTEYERVSLYGEMCGTWNLCIDCWVYNVTNFLGWMRGGSLEYIELAPYLSPDPFSLGSSYFDNVVPMYANIKSVLVMNTAVSVSFTDCTDIVEIRNMEDGEVINIALSGGQLIIDDSCIGGEAKVSGVGFLVNNSTGVAIDSTALLSDLEFVTKSIKNKRVITPGKYLVIYDDDGNTPILQKELRDVSGGSISDLADGVLAQEMASDV